MVLKHRNYSHRNMTKYMRTKIILETVFESLLCHQDRDPVITVFVAFI